MWLTQKKKPSTFLLSVLFLFVFSIAYCFDDETNIKNGDTGLHDLLFSDKDLKNKKNKANQRVLEKKITDSICIFKDLAFSYAKANEPELACKFIEKYVIASLDVPFVGHSYFDQISASESYKILADKYLKKFDWWGFFCFYVAFVGLFISVVLNFRKRSDKVANFLMSAFVLLHSFFIVHIGVYLVNYGYYFPHVYYMSTMFSFLYGPLIYFYFKRVTLQYSFKKIDILHLLPTVILIVLLFPIYILSAEEKLRIYMQNERPYTILIMVTKLISLLIYGVFVINMYIKYARRNTFLSRIQRNWQRNIVIFCSIYIVSYAVYSVLIIQHVFSGFLFYLQISSMAVLVLYVSYTAFVQPSLFGNFKAIVTEIKRKNCKYEKSGLTESLSLELKEHLQYLLDHEKIYKQNDITLQKLTELLDTTRHNTSQIINEHFGLNFFELMNKYRIEEAKKLLKGEKNKNFNIIDVAYEVGFNNKVTFNKSFKKYNQITPSEYLKLFVA